MAFWEKPKIHDPFMTGEWKIFMVQIYSIKVNNI